MWLVRMQLILGILSVLDNCLFILIDGLHFLSILYIWFFSHLLLFIYAASYLF